MKFNEEWNFKTCEIPQQYFETWKIPMNVGPSKFQDLHL